MMWCEDTCYTHLSVEGAVRTMHKIHRVKSARKVKQIVVYAETAPGISKKNNNIKSLVFCFLLKFPKLSRVALSLTSFGTRLVYTEGFENSLYFHVYRGTAVCYCLLVWVLWVWHTKYANMLRLHEVDHTIKSTVLSIICSTNQLTMILWTTSECKQSQ